MSYSGAGETPRAALLPHVPLEQRRGQLDQALQEVALHGVRRLLPDTLPRLVRLPQVSRVVEVDAAKVVLILGKCVGG